MKTLKQLIREIGELKEGHKRIQEALDRVVTLPEKVENLEILSQHTADTQVLLDEPVLHSRLGLMESNIQQLKASQARILQQVSLSSAAGSMNSYDTGTYEYVYSGPFTGWLTGPYDLKYAHDTGGYAYTGHHGASLLGAAKTGSIMLNEDEVVYRKFVCDPDDGSITAWTLEHCTLAQAVAEPATHVQGLGWAGIVIGHTTYLSGRENYIWWQRWQGSDIHVPVWRELEVTRVEDTHDHGNTDNDPHTITYVESVTQEDYKCSWGDPELIIVGP